MFEDAHRPLLSRQRFAARMAVSVLAAVFVNGVALAVGVIGSHFAKKTIDFEYIMYTL
jgi:hypothetical protein